MSISTKMKTDRAARLLFDAMRGLDLAADDLETVRPSDASADAAHDIGAAVRDALSLVKVCQSSAYQLNKSVQGR